MHSAFVTNQPPEWDGNPAHHDCCSELAPHATNAKNKLNSRVFYCVIGTTGYPSNIATIGIVRGNSSAVSICFASEYLDHEVSWDCSSIRYSPCCYMQPRMASLQVSCLPAGPESRRVIRPTASAIGDCYPVIRPRAGVLDYLVITSKILLFTGFEQEEFQ